MSSGTVFSSCSTAICTFFSPRSVLRPLFVVRCSSNPKNDYFYKGLPLVRVLGRHPTVKGKPSPLPAKGGRKRRAMVSYKNVPVHFLSFFLHFVFVLSVVCPFLSLPSYTPLPPCIPPPRLPPPSQLHKKNHLPALKKNQIKQLSLSTLKHTRAIPSKHHTHVYIQGYI